MQYSFQDFTIISRIANDDHVVYKNSRPRLKTRCAGRVGIRASSEQSVVAGSRRVASR